MASVQDSSKKEEHLKAGKRRLEEFRKKRAAKKPVSGSKPRAAESSIKEKEVLENGQVPVINSATPGSSGTTDDAVSGSSGLLNNAEPAHDLPHDQESESAPKANVSSETYSFSSADLFQMPNQVGNGIYSSGSDYQAGPIFTELMDHKVGTSETDVGERKNTVALSSGIPNALRDVSNFHPDVQGVGKATSFSANLPNSDVSNNDDAAKQHSGGHANYLSYPESELIHDRKGDPESKNLVKSVIEERWLSNPVGNSSSFVSQWASEPLSAGLNSNFSGSFDGLSSSSAAESFPRRSRPSFLDSLNIGRDSSSGRPFPGREDLTPSNLPQSNFASLSMIQDTALGSLPVEPLPTPESLKTSSDVFRGQKMFENSLESRLEPKSNGQNEDFAALEQHIEDLTQEKFSLQRALEASRLLAESLATENSSLTESYNQQASNANQLKGEMERLQEEIKARLVELEAFKAEYTNAQLECNAADERAKLLASEVISLEEKALRLRSNELKLERELENSSAEIASYKKKFSSLERERRDLQQTIEDLQEEKKLLQSKLRKASTSGVQIDLNKGHPKKDVSTSTNDIDLEFARDNPEQFSSSMQIHDDSDNLLSILQNGTSGFENVAMSIPPDQLQMIQNISSLISEIMSEKEEVMQALVNEVSTTAKLKDLNKELSHKLEQQTQRLELLTAQSMASETIPARQPMGSRIVRENVAYADEGDEVVERVLGWIMKLFPGGPSKRRTNRL